MSERSGGREQSEQSRASERVSGASEWANGRVSGPVLQSVFLAVIDHSAFSFLLMSSSSCDLEKRALKGFWGGFFNCLFNHHLVCLLNRLLNDLFNRIFNHLLTTYLTTLLTTYKSPFDRIFNKFGEKDDLMAVFAVFFFSVLHHSALLWVVFICLVSSLSESQPFCTSPLRYIPE